MRTQQHASTRNPHSRGRNIGVTTPANNHRECGMSKASANIPVWSFPRPASSASKPKTSNAPRDECRWPWYCEHQARTRSRAGVSWVTSDKCSIDSPEKPIRLSQTLADIYVYTAVQDSAHKQHVTHFISDSLT